MEISYQDLQEYTSSIDSASKSPTTWADIARRRSLDLMNPSSSENLNTISEDYYQYDSEHVDPKAGAFTGWTEKQYKGLGSQYGGAVRTVVLSGSSAELKNLHVEKNLDTNYLDVNSDLSVHQNLYVDGKSHLTGDVCLYNNLGVKGDSRFEGDSLFEGDVKVEGASDIEDLVVNGVLEAKGDFYVDGTSRLGPTFLDSLEVQGTSSFQGIATFNTTSVFKKDVYVSGNLFVEGSASYINTDQLYIEDKSITVASGAASAEQADGAGFDIAGAGVEFHYSSSTDHMTLNKNLEILGTGSVVAPTGSFQNLNVSNTASIQYLSAQEISASVIYGDGSHITNVTASIASSSKYRYPITIEPGESGRYTYPFYTPDVLVQVYEWNDPDFTPEWGVSGSEFDYTSGSIQFTEADIRVFASESVLPDTDVPTHYAVEITNNSSEPLNGYIVVADAGMMITGSIDILECTTDIAEFNVPGVSGSGNKDILEFSHRLGTKNVIVSFYKYDDIQDGVHTYEHIKWEPEQVSIPDKNHIKVVFNNTESISGYMVIAKAGHVVKESQIDDSWIQEHGVHYGDDGDWLANSFAANSGSFNILGVSEYIDTPKIGNLSTGEQYWKDYYDTPLWGSYIEFTDRGIASYVRNYGEISGSTPEDYSEETALPISTASLLDGNGDLYLAGGVITNHASFNLSDIREKHNVKTLTGSLDNIKKLRGVEFEWNKNNVPEIGTIAQEVQSIYPKLTRVYRTIEGEERLAVNYDGLVGVLIEAVKELSGKVDQLSQELEQLRNK